MHMQTFLNTETELSGRSDVPDEVVAALAAGGWPALRSWSKLTTQQQHETFVVDRSSHPAAVSLTKRRDPTRSHASA